MGGLFTVAIETGTSTDLLRLMLSPDAMCKGYIRFYKRDAISKLMDYEFFDTYIISHRTEFTCDGSKPLTDTLVFSPGILRIGDMVFEKHCKVTDLTANADKKTENKDEDFNIGPELN